MTKMSHPVVVVSAGLLSDPKQPRPSSWPPVALPGCAEPVHVIVLPLPDESAVIVPCTGVAASASDVIASPATAIATAPLASQTCPFMCPCPISLVCPGPLGATTYY